MYHFFSNSLANLLLGYTFSIIAESQFQAMQMMTFCLLPAMLLSGFVFPVAGVLVWGQYLGEVLPATHFLRIICGVMLKNTDMAEIWPNLWPLLLFVFGRIRY